MSRIWREVFQGDNFRTYINGKKIMLKKREKDFYYDMRRLRTAKTSARLFFMDVIRLLIKLQEILFHPSKIAISMSRRVNENIGQAPVHRPSVSQMCTIKFKCEKNAGRFLSSIFIACFLQIELYQVWHCHALINEPTMVKVEHLAINLDIH